MEKKSGGGVALLWGLAFVAFGVVIAGNIMDLFYVDIFFHGWWTLFIIIPCGIGIFHKHHRVENAIGLGIGVALLLSARDVISVSLVIRLIFPAICIWIGIALISKALRLDEKKNQNENSTKDGYGADGYSSVNQQMDGQPHAYEHVYTDSSEYQKEQYEWRQNNDNADEYSNSSDSVSPYDITAIMSSRVEQYHNKVFKGAKLTSIFGSITLDLRGAVLEGNVYLDAGALLGSIEVLVPYHVHVVVKATPILGGIENSVPTFIPPENQFVPTIYVDATAILGSMEIK